MATLTKLSLLLLFLSPLLSSSSSYSESSSQELTVIEGMVYCQCCKHTGSWSLSNAKPLAFAKVGIVCKDSYNKRVWFNQSFQSDKKGYYYAPIHGIMRGVCRVHLLSSPDRRCDILTNVNMGIDGAQVGDTKEKKIKNGVIYAAPPLAFRPGKCAAHYA